MCIPIPTKKDGDKVLDERDEKLERLNEIVRRKLKAAVVAANLKDAPPLPAEFAAAQRKMSILTSGAPIYVRRSSTLVILYSTIAAVCLASAVSRIGFGPTLLCAVVMFFGYDIYSGVLHIVLDCPRNIDLPLLGQPCLEFQWHHHIPDDIVRKDFFDVLGDLNVVVAILCGFHFCWSTGFGADPIALALTCFKLYMAYFGQYSHRSAHGAKTDPVARWLQKAGIMISKRDHHSHHKEPHNKDFCLIGSCNFIMDAAYSIAGRFDKLWLVIFVLWTLLDVVVFAKGIRWFIQSPSGVF